MKRAIIAVLMAALVVALPGVASAGDDVRKKGPCSAGSEWELRIERRDDNTFRVRWDVDSGVVGQVWNMSVKHNGQLIASGTRTTNADGEAEFRLRGVPNKRGTDVFEGSASQPSTGETCAGQASI